MAIEVKSASDAGACFDKGSLVVSYSELGAEANIYLVVGPGETEDTFAAVRLAGRGDFGYSQNILRSLVKNFSGEVLIKNG